MSRKKAVFTKPWLRPSGQTTDPPTLIFATAVILLTTLSLGQPVLDFVKNCASRSSVESVAAGISLLAFYFISYCFALYQVWNPLVLPRFFSPILGTRRLYHRSHVYHMRIDRLRRLMNNNGIRFLYSPQGFGFHYPRAGPYRHRFHQRIAYSTQHTDLAQTFALLQSGLSRGVLDPSRIFPPRVGGGGTGGAGAAVPRRAQTVKASNAWLNRIQGSENLELVEECRELLRRLPPPDQSYPLSFPGMSLRPEALMAFLGDTWLDDAAIYAGSRYIQYHIANPSIAFADSFHIPLLAKARESTTDYTPRTELDASLLRNAEFPVTQIFLPLHVYGAHWTLLHINLEANTYSYADCLWRDEDPPAEDMAVICWWLNGLGIDSSCLQRVPFAIPLPQQHDGSSCGVIVLSIMATLLLDYDSWSQEHAARERLRWFIRLCRPEPTDDTDYEDNEVEHVPRPPGPGDLNGSDDTSGSDDPGSNTHLSSFGNNSSSTSPCPSSTSPCPSTSSSSNILSTARSSSHTLSKSGIGKRSRKAHVVDSDLDDDDSDLSDATDWHCIKRRRQVGPREGTSWAWQKDLKLRSKEKSFRGHMLKLDNFRTKILAVDAHAEFLEDDLTSVRCSACGHWVSMRALYDTLRFTEHRGSQRCRGAQSTGLVTKTLWSMGFVSKKTARPTSACMVPVPCPGLTRQSDARIDTYLGRTSVQYGGAPSRTLLAQELFGEGTRWACLTRKQQRSVIRLEKVRSLWKNLHDIEAVFSTSCEGTIYSIADNDPRPCEPCSALYKLHSFQVAIRRPLPDGRNMKFVPKAYRYTQLGDIYLKYTGVRDLMEKEDGKSPWLKFAVGVVEGKYKSAEVLLGMVEAFIVKADRLERGKSLRNLKYSSAFSDFCDVAACLSPVAYRSFQEHFGGRSMESMRRIRSKRPRFQPGFSPSNVAAVKALLEEYKYSGPLALSWDDTDLSPAVSIYQESKNACIVIGGGDDVVRVDSGDDIDSVLAEAELKQATKLRLWLLTIPLPKIPPILVAAVARGSSSSAPELKVMHDRVVELLHMHEIFPISGASDGTETERCLQSMISRDAPSSKLYTIPNSHLPAATISLSIPLVDDKHPFVAVQDSKHALKTARNQILTGARLLTIGNGVLHYHQLHAAALAGSALLTADVGSGLDRQDDRAACRVFSSKFLEFTLRSGSQHSALSMYLFVLGELVDAWQNRRISHAVRAKMVLRARFFLMAWRAHVDAHPEHSVHIHFISRESFDIFITLCDSLLALMIVHRVYHPRSPFCPWLHSTEPCEHVFGVLRKIKPDFTYADMLAIERKLTVLIAGAFKNLTPEQKANATSAGYHHTYFDVTDLDLPQLSRMPTDQELALASDAAYTEASQLLLYVGIPANVFLNKYVPPSNQSRRTKPPVADPSQQTLSSLLSLYDNTWRGQDILKTELALAAESAAKSQEIEDLPELAPEDVTSIKDLLLSIQMEATANLLVRSSTQTSPGPTLSPLSIFVGGTLQADTLVAERTQHQTDFAFQAVRKTEIAPITADMNARTLARAVTEGLTLREQLTAKLRALQVEVKEVGASRGSGGVGRQVRHTGTFAGSLTTTQAETKATVKGVAATKFLHLREQAFAPLHGRIHENLSSANISSLIPLLRGQFVVALRPATTQDEVMEVFLGEVVTMYSGGNGKNAKHEWVDGIQMLGVASYIYVRKFVPFAGDSLFSALACQTLTSPSFIRVPRTHLLFSLGSYSTPRVQSVSVNNFDFDIIQICPASIGILAALTSHRQILSTSVRALCKLVAGKPVAAAAFTTAVADDASGSESDAEH